MNQPAYPEYKDSGVDYLGEIPKHWNITRVKFAASINPAKSEIRKLNSSLKVTFLPMEAIGELGELDLSQTRNLLDVIDGYTYVGERDVIIAKITPCFENGKGAIATGLLNGLAFATTEVVPIRPNSFLTSEFLYHLLSTQPFRKLAEGSMYGAGGQKRVADNFISNYKFAIPPKAEQKKIVKFLSKETAKIDLLIEKQLRLIELLKEKRQAFISHAVTKGLNPDTPMKDSGVEWLGEVPTHWQLKKLKHIKSPNPNSFVDGPFGSNLKSEHFIDNGDVYVIESNFATQNKLSPQKLKTISLEHFNTISRSSCQGGDIIIAKIGAQYGKSSILPVLDKPAVVSGNSLKLTVNASLINVEYLKHVLQHLKHEGAMDDIVNSTAQPALTLGGMNNISIPLPKLDEQEAIIHYINTESKRLNRAINSSKKLIELSRERRTALISAAVTGKIDVRDQVPQDVEEAVAS